MSKKVTLKLNQSECGVIFHSLKDKRNEMIREEKPTDAVDDVLIKVIDLIEEPPKKRKWGRDRDEAR